MNPRRPVFIHPVGSESFPSAYHVFCADGTLWSLSTERNEGAVLIAEIPPIPFKEAPWDELQY